MNFQKSENLSNLDKPIISLLSTGLDSPVSTYLMMRQGFDCVSLTFLNGGELSNENKLKIIKIGKKLKNLTNRNIIMHFVHYDEILESIRDLIEPRITCILCKRIMVKTASLLAKRYNAIFMINGDILGEQASQTMDNLLVVHQVNKEIPLLRPLIGFNKLDVVKISQKIGLYPLCIEKAPACTFNPKFPETRANLQQIKSNEKRFDPNSLVEVIIEKMEILRI